MALTVPIPQNQSIAVIDDSAAVRKSLQLLLGARGFRVDVFSGSLDLLSATSLASYDCFVIDLKLEGTTGAELLAGLRELGLTQPAILISGWDVDSLGRVASEGGFAAQVPKPMMENSIVDEIVRVLNLGEGSVNNAGPAAEGSGKS